MLDVVLLTSVNFHDLLVIPRDDQRISYVLLEFFLEILFSVFFLSNIVTTIPQDEEVKPLLPANTKSSSEVWGNMHCVFPASHVNR